MKFNDLVTPSLGQRMASFGQWDAHLIIACSVSRKQRLPFGEWCSQLTSTS